MRGRVSGVSGGPKAVAEYQQFITRVIYPDSRGFMNNSRSGRTSRLSHANLDGVGRESIYTDVHSPRGDPQLHVK